MSREIADELGGGGKAILLDPASQMTITGEEKLRSYDLDGNNGDNKGDNDSALNKDRDGYFKNKFTFSRAFVGSRSVAGSDKLSITAHEAFEMNFGDIIDIGSQHFDVIKSYERMLRENEVYNNGLNIQDNEPKSMFIQNSVGNQNQFEGVIEIKDRTFVNQIETGSGSNKVRYGTINDNDFYLRDSDQNIIYGGDGNDKLTILAGRFDTGAVIKDFGDNDKIKLSREYVGAPYVIREEDGRPVLYQDFPSKKFVKARIEGEKGEVRRLIEDITDFNNRRDAYGSFID